MDGDRVPRRSYLEALLATGVVASTAGCNSSQDTSTTNSPTDTQTATPNEAPQILAHKATSQDNGTSLAVYLEGKDDRGIETAAIQYGEEELRETPNDTEIVLDGELTGLEDTSLENTPGRVRYRLQDTDGKETRAEVYPDETAPELHNFSAEPTESAGEIGLLLEGRDDIGLDEVQLLLGEQPQLRENASGQNEHSIDREMEVSEDTRFQQNTVTASVEDWNGNTTESEAETYVRKFDVMQDTQLRPAVEYIPWAGSKFGTCFTEDVHPQPTVGRYDVPPDPEVVSNHIDQMTAFGVERLKILFNGTESSRQELKPVMRSDLIDQISVEPDYPIQNYRWFPSEQYEEVNEDPNIKDEIIPRDMGFLRDQVLSRNNTTLFQGRPVVTFWGSMKWINEGYQTRIMDNYGSYSDFVDDIRSELKHGSKDPFLVANVGANLHKVQYLEGNGELPGYPDLDALTQEFDGVCTWTGGAAEGWGTQATNAETLDWVEENFKSIREYTDAQDMEFIPTVFPGFDERGNTCWGQDRYTSRSTESFRNLLQLANEYRTTDMVNIATWNDWTEGTQIEPGTFRGTDYGTEYLEIVQEFQSTS